MNEECPKCMSDGKLINMDLKTTIPDGFELNGFKENFVEEKKIYQCPECKNVEVL